MGELTPVLPLWAIEQGFTLRSCNGTMDALYWQGVLVEKFRVSDKHTVKWVLDRILNSCYYDKCRPLVDRDF